MRNSPNRIVATVFGAVYVLVGLLGFAVTSGVGFIATEGGLLLGVFQVNPLHNIAHILIGGALLASGFASATAARAVNTTVGAVYLLLGIAGFFLGRQYREHPGAEHARPLPPPRERHRAARSRPRVRALDARGDGVRALVMRALAAATRSWPMLAAVGAGLVLLAVAAGAGGIVQPVTAVLGVVALAWSVVALRAGRLVAPTVVLVACSAFLVGAGALVAIGPGRASGCRGGAPRRGIRVHRGRRSILRARAAASARDGDRARAGGPTRPVARDGVRAAFARRPRRGCRPRGGAGDARARRNARG